MRVIKYLLMMLLLLPTLATASAFVGTVESNIAPSPGGSDSGNSAEVQNLEDQVQMRGGQGDLRKLDSLYQNRYGATPSSNSFTTRASIRSNGEYYCPPRRGFGKATVSSYKPDGYAQCVYQPLSR